MSITHRIAVADYGSNVQAWLLDLPGCIVAGADLAEAEAKLPLAITEHIAWLRSHGEMIESAGQWEIVETLSVTGDFCFASECVPLSAGELDGLVARMAYARAAPGCDSRLGATGVGVRIVRRVGARCARDSRPRAARAAVRDLLSRRPARRSGEGDL